MTSGASGKKIVFLLYGTAILLCLGLLWFGKRAASKTPGRDGVPTVEALAALRALPSDWTRITTVEGQGWVIYVPCGSPAGTLRLEAFEDRPRIACEFCDSLSGARILGFASDGLAGLPAPGRIRFDVDVGRELEIQTVDSLVRGRFPGAPLKDYLLVWKISPEKALFFVPTLGAGYFETLRAEDESPEGCADE
jgi:hypothetical protein